jgi:polysaccharide export outer membrane protein
VAFLFTIGSGRWAAFMAGFFFLVVGCQGVQRTSKPLEASPEPIAGVSLGPGDSIEIKFFFNPELNDMQTVRPDGMITLQLAGDVFVHGMAPEELREHLRKIYAAELSRPEIAIIVRSWGDRRVYVGGEVNKPGIFAIPGRLTALEAIMEAGGFKMETAKVKNIVVIRYRDGQYKGSLLDLKDALAGKEVQPFYLYPRDIVYVPQTTIVKVDQWVDQYIYRLLPLSKAGFGFSWIP